MDPRARFRRSSWVGVLFMPARTWLLLSTTGYIVLGLFLVACVPTRPQQTLVFEHRTATSRQLYSGYPDGSHLTLMAQVPLSSLYFLSPDGSRIAYLNPPTVWPAQAGYSRASSTLTVTATHSQSLIGTVENAEQTSSSEIFADEAVTWSPQGDAFVFLRDSQGKKGTDLYLFRLATHQIVQLTADEAIDRSPQWSPDAKLIAFVSQERCGQAGPDCSGDYPYWNVEVIRPDGSQRRTIAAMRQAKFAIMNKPSLLRELCNLRWSPDGKFVIFENECGYIPSDYREVFVATLDGTKALQLTNLSSWKFGDDSILASYAIQPSSTGDRLFIGFTQIPFAPPKPGRTFEKGLMVFNTSDFSASTLIDNVGTEATIAGDGQHIAWHPSDLTLPSVTFLGKLDDHKLISMTFPSLLPNNACSYSPFRWSPDSQYVAYTMAEQNDVIDKCDANHNRGIAVISLRDNKVVNVAETVGGDNRLIGWLSTMLTQP